MAFTLQRLMAETAAGEDSTRQFKSKITNVDALAAEMAAFANANGRVIFIGVQDDGVVSGIPAKAVAPGLPEKALRQRVSGNAR